MDSLTSPSQVARDPRALRTSCFLLAALVIAPTVAAQEIPAPEMRGESLHALERPTYMSSLTGPPGTEVTLRASLLPALTPVQVALGGTRSGFEALALSLTDRDGNLVETVRIPDWAERDRTHRFIIFNAYFTSVYATTGLFHVTDAEGRLVREGEVIRSGGSCTTVAGVDNEIYSLIGDFQPLDEGTRIRMEGLVRFPGECPEGMTLEVAELAPARE